MPPFPVITDIDGNPLEDGYIYIGAPGVPAESSPTSIYWDAALTIPAAQPVRTLGGYPMRSGSPAVIYTNGDYSIAVKNKNGSMVYQSLNATARSASLIATTVPKTGAYTVVGSDQGSVLLCSGTWTLALTAAATLGNGFSVGVINTGAGVITINPAGSELIDGAATLDLTAGQSCFITCTGTEFRSVGLSGSGGGGAINGVFYEGDKTITTNYTITAGKNAMSAGPVTIADGVTVTVPTGSTWSIV
jgi:hypothetical protein